MTNVIQCQQQHYTYQVLWYHYMAKGGFTISCIALAVHLLAIDCIVTTKVIISPQKIVYLDSKIVTATMHGCNYNMLKFLTSANTQLSAKFFGTRCKNAEIMEC